jgi:uncharacterized protein (TIGR04255 family)
MQLPSSQERVAKAPSEMESIPVRHPLANKPLVEAIFEVRWGLGADGRDPGFRIFLGRYYDQVKKTCPVVRDLPISQVPEEMTGHVVRHQFWKAPNTWPVSQVGPGIMTFNETSGYLWDSFRPRLVEVIAALYHSYPTDLAPFTPIQATLRYVDSVEFDPKNNGPLLVFLRERLHTSVEIDRLLFESEDERTDPIFSSQEERTNPLGLNLSVTLRLQKPNGIVTLTIAKGTITEGSRKVPSLIWETSVHSKANNVPNTVEHWQNWIDDAHRVSDRVFFALTRGDLLKTFEGEHANGNVEIRD